MSGGQYRLPMVVRAPGGGGIGMVAQPKSGDVAAAHSRACRRRTGNGLRRERTAQIRHSLEQPCGLFREQVALRGDWRGA